MGDPRNAASVMFGGKHGLGILLSSTLLTLVVAQPVLAAEEDKVEEFVVTAPHYVPQSNSSASKLDVPLIETPQSISVVTRDQILDVLWGVDHAPATNVVDSLVRSLRARLEDDFRRPRYIATVPGQGYRLVEPSPSPSNLVRGRDSSLRAAS